MLSIFFFSDEKHLGLPDKMHKAQITFEFQVTNETFLVYPRCYNGNLLILKIIHYLSEIEIYIYPSFLYLKNQGTLGKAKMLRIGYL